MTFKSYDGTRIDTRYCIFSWSLEIMKAPFNISVIDPIEYIQRKSCLPVSSHSVYESSSEQFHPDGLFSEVIFGQVGSTERLIKRGYIELNTKLVNPHLYKQWMRVKSLYKDVVAGKKYAYFDKNTRDLVATSQDDPNANTGYSFFLSVIPKLRLEKNDSVQRNNRIEVLDKYSDKMFIDKMLVLPAGVRDVKVSNGRASSDEINKIYLSLLSLAKSLPFDGSEDPMYDVVRYQMQLKVQEIYDYIINIIRGKHGFAQGKYAARAVTYSNRNVITAAITSRTASAKSKNLFSVDEVQLPLYQAMKAAVPVVVNNMKKIFFEQIFDPQSNTVALLNPKTFKLEYHEITSPELIKYTTLDGIEKIIDNFRHIEKAFDVVTVKVENPVVIDGEKVTEFPLFGVYDTGTDIIFFRSIDDLRESHAKKQRYRDDNPLYRVFDLCPEIQSHDEFIIEGSGCMYAFGMDTIPVDIDIVPNRTLWDRLSKRTDKEVDEFGDFEIVIDGIEIHVKNNVYGIKNQQQWEEIRDSCTIMIGNHRYMSPETLLPRYENMHRVKDTRRIEFLRSIVIEMEHVRFMTYVELCYYATQRSLSGKHCTVTRYPVLNIENLALYKIHLMSTTPGRVVNLSAQPGFPSFVIPEYPVMSGHHKTIKQSISLHPSALELMGADHDGDTVTLNVLLSDEANKEIHDYFEDTISLLTPDGQLIYNTSTKWIVPMSLLFCTHHKIKE